MEKYNKIQNSYNKEFTSELINKNKGRLFVVEEKIHGANVSFQISESELDICRREDVLLDNEKFYNHLRIKNKFTENVKGVFKYIKTKYDNIDKISIFGELFGGGYPHKEVSILNTEKLVVDGVYYSNKNEFIAYDIKINESYFMNRIEANELLAKFGFFVSDILFVGSLEECIEFNNTYPSKIPFRLGLPELPGNICEGNVIKALDDVLISYTNRSRPTLKNKNEQWSENNKKIDRKILNKIRGKEIPESTRELMISVISYISENRLDNLISKIGEFNREDYGKVISMYSKDVIEDFSFDFPEFTQVDKKERKRVQKIINKYSSKLINEYLVRED